MLVYSCHEIFKTLFALFLLKGSKYLESVPLFTNTAVLRRSASNQNKSRNVLEKFSKPVTFRSTNKQLHLASM